MKSVLLSTTLFLFIITITDTSTLIACEQSDRICYTVELDEKFCDIIVKRYIEQVGSSDGVTVQRDGVTFRFDEVANVDN